MSERQAGRAAQAKLQGFLLRLAMAPWAVPLMVCNACGHVVHMPLSSLSSLSSPHPSMQRAGRDLAIAVERCRTVTACSRNTTMFMITTTLATALCAAPPTFDLDFEGGSVAEWVTAIRAVSTDANIVVAEAVERAPVPAMHVHGVTLKSVMGVSSLNEDSAINCARVSTDAAPIWVVSSNSPQPARGRGGASGHNEMVTAIFNLPPGHRDQADATKLVKIIIGVVSLDGGGQLQTRLMPETGLLAIRGLEDQVETASDVIDAIEWAHNRSARGPAKPRATEVKISDSHMIRAAMADIATSQKAAGSPQAQCDLNQALKP